LHIVKCINLLSQIYRRSQDIWKDNYMSLSITNAQKCAIILKKKFGNIKYVRWLVATSAEGIQDLYYYSSRLRARQLLLSICCAGAALFSGWEYGMGRTHMYIMKKQKLRNNGEKSEYIGSSRDRGIHISISENVMHAFFYFTPQKNQERH
ncbi:hypothetical protein ACJX0J_041268, partial [Zea mays]